MPCIPQTPAIVEPLEPRVHLTATFTCSMSAQTSGRTVSVVLWTTGGKASQYVVHWNDTNSGGSTSITYTAPADGSPLTESYTYHGSGSFTPSAVTAVATLSGSSSPVITATAYYALDKTFGNFQGATGSGATIDVPTSYGNVAGHSPSSFEGGEAYGVWVDTTDGGGHFVAVGTNGSSMVAVGEFSSTLTAYTSGGSTSWPGTYGIRSYSYASGTGTPNDATGFGVTELDDASNYQGTDDETLIMAGNTQWCDNCAHTSGSDFTLVQINDSDGSVGPLGSIRTNIGQTLGSSATTNPSYDVAFSVVPFSSTGAGPLYLTAVGQSTALGSDRFTMVQYKPNSGHNGYVLVSTFGQYSDGILTGPTGDAYAAVPDNFSTGTFEVLGTSGGDFLVAKYTISGTLDSTFGNAGLMYQDFGDTSGNNSTDIGYSLAIATDGSLLACGTTVQPGTTKTRIALADLLDGNQLTVS